MEEQNSQVTDSTEISPDETPKEQLKKLSLNLADKMQYLIDSIVESDGFGSQYTEVRIGFLRRVVECLLDKIPELYERLSDKEMQHLGEIEWRCHRACTRLQEAISVTFENNLPFDEVDSDSRLKKEFDIVESLSSEILAYIDLYDSSDDERKQISRVLKELKLAREMYTQLIEKLGKL